MKIGATVRLDQPVTKAADATRLAEELGYASVWVADHYFHRDASAALALMMAATEHIQLGTAVVSPLLRHPTLLASLSATLREIGPDRFVLGLGVGGYEFPTEMNLSMRRPLRVTEEAVDIVRQLTAGRSDVAGEYFSARNSALRWTAQDGPLYLAARGPKMLELAGRIADGVITHGIAPTHIAFVNEKVAAGASGDSPRAKVCLMLDVEIDDDQDKAIQKLAPRCTTMAGGAYADELIEIYGLNREEVLALRATVRSGDRALAGRQVTPQMARAFGLAGSAAEVADGLRELADQGVDEVIVSVGGADGEQASSQLSALAREVF